MKAVVDQSICIGCGLCADICPEVFSLNDRGVAQATEAIPADCEDLAEEAADNCPVGAISFTR